MTVKKFLAIAFMCHQRPDRSFFIRGHQLPLCARCTGILVGYFLGIVAMCLTECAYYKIGLLLILPMIADGALQQRFKIESTNMRRLITGILGGISIICYFVGLHKFTVWWVKIVLDKIL